MNKLKLWGIFALALAIPIAAQNHRMGEPGVTAPRLIYKVEPQYTEEARAAKVAGTVILNVVVDEKGFVHGMGFQI